MNETKDGGPAFPSVLYSHDAFNLADSDERAAYTAFRAYLVADFMLVERS